MKILHTSDLHGNIQQHLEKVSCLDFDVWIDTGDFFKNYPTYVPNRGLWIEKNNEIKNQKDWLQKEYRYIESVLRNRPFISVSGNHDFISLGEELIELGLSNIYQVDTKGVELFNIKFAGFPNIPMIEGIWNHETNKEYFANLFQELEKSNPDILVCHCPPRGILDLIPEKNIKIGVDYNSFLSYSKHKIKHMFFGHCHEQGGKKEVIQEMNISFYNGAGHAIIHEIKIM